VKKTNESNELENKFIPVKKFIKEENGKVFYKDFNDEELCVSTDELEKQGSGYVEVLNYRLGTDRFGRDVLEQIDIRKQSKSYGWTDIRKHCNYARCDFRRDSRFLQRQI
jgi:intein-encoded DNA endonuclease-like protein